MVAHENKKRKSSADQTEGGVVKRQKAKKKWAGQKRHDGQYSKNDYSSQRDIEPGDSGIWATCDLHREARSIGQLRDLFEQHASRTCGTSHHDQESPKKDSGGDDIAAEVDKELEYLRKADSKPFTSIRLDTQCLLFFKTAPQIDPVAFALSFCRQAALSVHQQQTRAVKRLTPITLTGKATEKGVDELAERVLAPHFHSANAASKKFAIRVNMRNHSSLNRESVIKQVATAVGPNHKVDLKNYDLLVLVEIYKSICGMSVVTKEYDALKKFNLAEIYTMATTASLA